MQTIQQFVTTNRPQAVTLTAEQIITTARECGYAIELPTTDGKYFWSKWFASEKGDVFALKVIATDGKSHNFKGTIIEISYTHNLTMDRVVYSPLIDGRHEMSGVLKTLLEKLNIPTTAEVATPEPVVRWLLDHRDGALKEGIQLFLSRARELARGDEALEKVFQEPTGEILWEKEEWCWINCCWGATSAPYATKKEAQDAHQYGYCNCGENTAIAIKKFTLIYGGKKYLPDEE